MENKPFIVADNEIKPGSKKTLLFPAPSINTQVKMDIPVHIFHGKFAGPRIFIIAGIHGDELNGVEIIRRVHEHIHLHRLHGTIITAPSINPHGIMMQSRYLSDRRDLNRSFPGAKRGTLAARLAHGIMRQLVKHCDYGVDLHTGALGRINMPQLRVDFSVPKARTLAKYFDTPVILQSKQRDGSLRQAAAQMGIPVLVYEGGEALRYNELCIRAGVRGIIRVLHFLKMQKCLQQNTVKYFKSMITETSRWVRAPMSGIVQPYGDLLGKSIKKGQVLAHVHDPALINPSVKVLAPFEGIVIGKSLKIIATEGDALFHVASFKKVAGVSAYIEDLREEIEMPITSDPVT